MSVDFIGMINARKVSEIHPPTGPAIDPGYIASFAQAHEAGGFDRILIGYFTNAADSLLVAAQAAFATSRIGLMVAHRPGFTAPTLAARQFATLDQLSRGRAAIHVISGGDDADQRKDGDYAGHGERYERTDEYVGILKAIWSSDRPVSHTGEHYRFENAFSDVKPYDGKSIPIYFGGSSDAAIRVAARHADTFALWGETLAQTRETVTRVRAAAAAQGRTIRFSLSLRPILAATEQAAWERAHEILQLTRQRRGEAMLGAPGAPANVGSQRLLDAARQGEVVDKRLYTAIAAATGAKGNTTALVGTPEQVAESLLDYWDLGITTFLIRGFDPLEDAIQYGRELLPIVRAAVAAREARGRRPAA